MMADNTKATLPMSRALKANKASVPKMNGMEAMTLKINIIAKAGKIFLAAFFFLSRAAKKKKKITIKLSVHFGESSIFFTVEKKG